MSVESRETKAMDTVQDEKQRLGKLKAEMREGRLWSEGSAECGMQRIIPHALGSDQILGVIFYLNLNFPSLNFSCAARASPFNLNFPS